MLIMTATTDKIQVITDVTNTVDVHASWMDYNGTTVTPGRTNTAITTATTTDIVAAPASSTQRNVKTIHIRNKHATSAVTITVQFNQNATLFELHKLVLNAGDALEYIEGVGFFLLAMQLVTGKRLAADQSNSTTTATEVTGLTLALPVGTYRFRYNLVYQGAATTTGVKFSCNFDGTTTRFVYFIYTATALATGADGNNDQTIATAAGGIFQVMADRAGSVAGLGANLTEDTANADMLAIIEGTAVVTVTGNLELWHASEVAAQSSVMAGSNVTVAIFP